MSLVNIRLPHSLHRKASEAAHLDGISIDQFIATAIAEKLSVLMTLDYLRNRADRSSSQAFEEALSEIPDVEPEEYDRL
jgi:hypothetical protein